MAVPALDYTYRYVGGSRLDRPTGALQLATFSGGEDPHPHFFSGRLLRPRLTADLLRALMRVVHGRYHVPAAMLERILLQADPVVTSAEQRLRFEGFSGCCGVYARLDLLPEAIHSEYWGKGTTNVDFNQPMLNALATVGETETLALAVGTDRVELTRGREQVIERKVKLPLRWLKGFVEVQACQSRMRRALCVTGLEGFRFLRSLPRMKTSRRESWVVASGRGLRISQVGRDNGVRIGGLERLRVLEGAVSRAESLQVFADPSGGSSAWVLDFGVARFSLVISPEVWRGFSGEGQALASLAGERWRRALPTVRAWLAWQPAIDCAELAAATGIDEDAAIQALVALGARGLVGFDLGESSFFHRELPFSMDLVDALQPRLLAARKLVDAGRVRRQSRSLALVQGTGVEHRVQSGENGDRCTCPWYARHGNERGPCKHILAVHILQEAERE